MEAQAQTELTRVEPAGEMASPDARSASAAVVVTPMEMLHLAIEQGADIERLQKLMDLQERWEGNQARKAFLAALADFKAAAPLLRKNKHVEFRTSKGTTSYDHATLDQVSGAIAAGLAPHGMSHRWNVEQKNGLVIVTCILSHVAGHSATVTMECRPDDTGSKNPIQAIGSATEYLRRYTLLAITGLATGGWDDDGNGGRGRVDERQDYPQEAFDRNLPQWTALIKSSKCSAADVITKIETKAALTNSMKDTILAIE